MDKLKTTVFYLAIIPTVIAFWGGVTTAVYFFDDIQEMRELVLAVDPATGLSPIEEYELLNEKMDLLWEEYEER